MPFRKVAIRSSSSLSFLGFAVAGFLAAGLATNSARANTTLNSGTTTVSTGRDFGSELYVALSGTATMNVVPGGYAINNYAYLGHDASAVGTVNVSSGTWTNRSDLNVGRSGIGTLNVNGGSVTSSIGYIGFFAGSVGTATVSSGTWANSSDLFVGNSGTGAVSVNGGSVINTTGYLGYNARSVGTATVSSGTWANSGDLAVGVSGTGTLTISGGLMSVGGTLSRGTFGTINLNAGGTLQIGVGTTSGVLLGGTGSLTNNGTFVFNRSDALTYSGVLSGSGAVTKQGTGILGLAGANSYSGLTTIAAGTLALSGTGSIGTGGLNLGSTGSPGVFDLSALTAGSYSLPSSGNLAGVGTLSGSGKSLAVLGSLAPGNSAGTITVGSGLSLDLANSGTSLFEITNPAFTAGTYDLLNGDGSVVFGGILNLAFSGGSYAEGTDVLQLFANTGGRSGNFSAVNSTGLAAGQSATFNSATGLITVVPEPSTYAISALATAGFASLMRWRKRRTRESEA